MKNKKVLLIDPTFNPGNIPPNLGLGEIESRLNQYGVECFVADFILLEKPDVSLNEFYEFESIFVEFCNGLASNADVVYISGSHGMEMKPYAMFPRIARIAKAIKKSSPATPIIFGGALARYYSLAMGFKAKSFKDFGIDSLIDEREAHSAYKILEAVDIEICVTHQSLSSTPDENILTPSWQAWDLHKYPDYISMMVQVGCPFSCSFCFEGKIYEPQPTLNFSGADPTLLKYLQSRHRLKSIMLEDSIAISLPWFPSFMEMMRKSELNWAIYARANEIVNYNERVSMLSAAGCRSVVLGIESFEDEILASTKKKITTAQSLRALEICAEHEIAVQGCMILAFPTDNLDAIERRVIAAGELQLSCYRWHILQPDWTNLPKNILGLDNLKIEDHFELQVSIPDSAIPEYLESAPPMAFYDEHMLIRALPEAANISRLSQFGYSDRLNFLDLARKIKPLILDTGLPTNEDEMYPLLFNPDRLAKPRKNSNLHHP